MTQSAATASDPSREELLTQELLSASSCTNSAARRASVRNSLADLVSAILGYEAGEEPEDLDDWTCCDGPYNQKHGDIRDSVIGYLMASGIAEECSKAASLETEGAYNWYSWRDLGGYYRVPATIYSLVYEFSRAVAHA